MKQRFSKRTRLVSALLTLAMVFTFLPFSAFAAGTGDIPIDADHFPDPAFQKYLSDKYGSSLSPSEIDGVTEIDVRDGYNGQKITSLKGIEFFPNLGRLDCHGNQLTELDVRNNTALWCLSCDENNLTSLDVSHHTQLEQLYCGRNQLTELDVRNNTKLWYLYCSENKLTSLALSQNTRLNELYCSKNNLTSLDLSQTVVATLKASDNQISINVETTPRTFDLSKLPGKFDVTKADNWNGGTVSGNTLTVNEGVNQVTYTYDCGKGCNATFTLNVNVVPDGTPGGTTPGGSTGGSTGGSSGGDGGGGGAIIAVAGAAAVGLVGYGIYNYVAERQLQALLPEGAASPENRAQTALLLWNTAGRPEPAAQPAFPDVADPETAKAAQWCVEHGLMNLKFRGRFAPDGSSPAYKTLNAYRQLVG